MTDPAEPPVTPGNAPAISHRRISRRRLWQFRLMAAALPFVCLLVLELAFRVLGVGQDLSLVVVAPGNPSVLRYQLNDSADLVYYGRTPLAGPESRRFDLPKPANTFRVVFLGASTVIGFPYAPEVAFPRQAEVILSRQSPETHFEVLNAGIVSINSFAVADLARECLACDPDAIVVHSGHNEFYGPGGPASSALSLPPLLIRATYGLRRLRLVQLLTSIGSRKPAEDDLLNTLPRTLEVPMSGPVFRQAEKNLRDNLERVVRACRSAHVPVVLSTVASNIRDQSPMRAIWPADVSEAQRPEWEKLMEEAERRLSSEDHAGALQQLAAAEKICSDHARLQYRKAQCLDRMGQANEAREAYTLARDEDACRFRAPSSFRNIIRDVAEASSARDGSSSATKDVIFLDIDDELEKVANPAGAGFDLYLEHVHYNAAGHRQLGRLFARCLHEQVRRQPWDESHMPPADELDKLLGMTPEDDLAAYSFSLQVFQTGPLRGSLDHEHQEQWTTEEISRLFAALPIERREAFADLPMNLMSQELMLALADVHQARKNSRLSEQFIDLAVLRRPWSAAVHLAEARACDRRGDVQGARKSVSTSLELWPDWPPAASFQDVLPPP